MPTVRTCEDVADLPALLSVVLASRSDPDAAERQAPALLAYLQISGSQWRGWCVGEPARPQAAVVALLLPGRTAMLLCGDPQAPSLDAETQRRLVCRAIDELREMPLHYVQALLDQDDAGRASALSAAGFAALTRLSYLERGATYPWCDPPDTDAVAWDAYAPDTHDRFEQTVLGTYEDSRDCPELSGLRPMHDVLAAHKASGVFDPSLWQLARVTGDEDAGCVLLARMPDPSLVEIVYMGLRPAWRGRGLGQQLMRRALQQARMCKAQRVTVVVDERNTPARRLYERFGFAPIDSRQAYLLQWKRNAPPQ